MPALGPKLIALAAAAALAGGLAAPSTAPASPSGTMRSAAARAKERAHLRRVLLRRPGIVRTRWFARRAALVSFRLPITIRLRGSAAASNPNLASVDLGTTLGPRNVGLGGTLAGEVTFHDSRDGGPLGNVDIAVLPSPAKTLSTTSIPLLWNHDVTATDWDTTGVADTSGCRNFTGASGPPIPYDGGSIDVVPGVDDPARLVSSSVVGDPDHLGTLSSTFAYPLSPAPGVPPDPRDAVLRTAPLTLGVVPAGTAVPGPPGAPDIVVGPSGGQANLFGKIPGTQNAVDVTVSLGARITTILRLVDQDWSPVATGGPWTAWSLSCRQVVTGAVPNFLPGIRLVGDLRISPAITQDGHLRIARVSLHSAAPQSLALAACLVPYAAYAAAANGSDAADVTVPTPPLDPLTARPLPSGADCKATPTKLLAGMVAPLGAPGPGYTVSNDGSQVVVTGALSVTNVSADVLVGDV